jgi:predicted NACHT family NTPase
MAIFFNYKYKIAYRIAGTVLFSLAQFMLPVAAQINSSNEMHKTQVESSTRRCQFPRHFDSIESVDISSDGKKFISASRDNTIKLWDVSTGKLLRTFKGTGYRGLLSPNGKIIISASYDNTIKLWDVFSGNLLRTLAGHSDSITSLTISQDNKMLVSSSWDKSIKIWDISTGKLIRRLRGHSEWVNSAIISPDGATVISGSSDKTIKLWDIKKKREIRTLKGSFDGVSSVAISQGKRILKCIWKYRFFSKKMGGITDLSMKLVK